MSPLYYLDERGGESFLGRGPVMLPHSCTIFIHLSFPFNLDKGHCHIPPFNTPLCSRVTPYQRSSTPLSPHFNTLLFVFCLPQTIGSPLFLPPIRTYILLSVLIIIMHAACILTSMETDVNREWKTVMVKIQVIMVAANMGKKASLQRFPWF